MAVLMGRWFGLILWFWLDPWIEQGLMRRSESTRKRLFLILDQENAWLWQTRRYRTSHALRWFWLLAGPWFSAVWMDGVLLVAVVGLYLWPMIKLKQKAARKVAMIRYQFPIYLRQLQILLQNNTVVKAIELSIAEAPRFLRNDLKLLHARLIRDPLKLCHYTEFMAYTGVVEIERAMKWLYRFENSGQADAGRQFNRMIASTAKWLRQERQNAKQHRLLLSQWLGMVPLIGVTLVFLSVMMNVLMSLFERR
jgi:hypothetical protein